MELKSFYNQKPTLLIRLCLSFLLIAVFPEIAKAASAGVKIYGYSFAMAPSLNSQGVTVFFTTWDGSTGPPLQDPDTGNVSGEFEPVTLGSTNYRADYIAVTDVIRFEEGEVNITVDSSDTDKNGVPDFLQIEKGFNGNFSGKTTVHWNATGSTQPAIISGTMNRSQNSTTGTYQASYFVGTTLIAISGTWGVTFASGSLIYSNKGSGTQKMDLILRTSDGQTFNVSGNGSFSSSGSDHLLLNSFILRENTQNEEFKTFTTALTRNQSIYHGNIQLEDGGLGTFWRDFQHYYIEIDDRNDANGNGIPDLTDAGSPPTSATISNSIVDGDAPIGTDIGSLSASDPDNGDLHSFALINNPFALFKISNRILQVSTPLQTHAGETIGVTIRITDSSGFTLDKDFQITIEASENPPVITQQPTGRNALVNETVVFEVRFAGSPTISFQWYFNDIPINGANGALLALVDTQKSNEGMYRIKLQNSFGEAFSDNAHLTVSERPSPPTILKQPNQITVDEGSELLLEIQTSGSTPFKVVWWFNGGVLANQESPGLLFENATSSNAGTYQVVISNSLGSVTSQVIRVLIVPPTSPPEIVMGLTDRNVKMGNSIEFLVNVLGDEPFGFIWKFNGESIPGATAENIVIPSVRIEDSGLYEVIVSNESGKSASSSANLTVLTQRIVDFNGDGKSDFFFQRTDGALAVWFMDGMNRIGATVLDPDNLGNSSWNVVNVTDIDQDLDSDLILQNSDGVLGVWIMNRTILERSFLLEHPLLPNNQFRVIGTGDIDQNGTHDILIQEENGSISALLMSNLEIIDIRKLISTVIEGFNLVGVGEFSEDSAIDLITQSENGELRIFPVRSFSIGNPVSISSAPDHSGEWRFVDSYDLINDGRKEILFQHFDGSLRILTLVETSDDKIETVSLSIQVNNPGAEWHLSRIFSSNSTLPEPPVLKVLQLVAGTVLLSVEGNSGTTYDIEASGNFESWIKIGSVKLDGNNANYADPREAVFQNQFYRSVIRR